MVPEVAGSNPVFHPFKKPCSNAGLFCSKAAAVQAYLLSVNQSDGFAMYVRYIGYVVLRGWSKKPALSKCNESNNLQ